MPYSTPIDVRRRAVGMTEEVIPDASETGLSLATCIAEADAEIDEAARAGDYETPFDPVPERIAHLSAVGALARARRALHAGNQVAVTPDPYRQEFEAGLALLRAGRLDLGAAAVEGEEVVIPAADGEWAALGRGAILRGSVTITNQAGSFTYVEDRRTYEPGYRPEAIKDYEVDHRAGRVRRLAAGRLGRGQAVLISYRHYLRQPGDEQEAEYERRSASSGAVMRLDQVD